MSIKLGNVTINKIKLGTTAINKVYLGSTQVFPAGGGTTVLDGFESFSGGLPNTLNWQESGTQTVTQTSSNVTQGSFSCRIQTTSGGINTTGFGVSLAGKTTLRMDVFVASVQPTGGVYIDVYSVVDDALESDSTVAGATGSDTLVIDLTAFTNLTDMEFTIGSVGTETIDFYIDNLRAS